MIRHIRHRVPTWVGGAATLLVPALVVCMVPSANASVEPTAAAESAPIATVVSPTPNTVIPGSGTGSATVSDFTKVTTSRPVTTGPNKARPGSVTPAATTPAAVPQTGAKDLAMPATTSTRGTTTSTAPTVTRIPVSGLKLMNYNPAKAPWLAMWQRYNHAQINSDFAAIHSLGANAVRIAIDPAAVGWPTLTTTGANELIDIVATAKANGLQVQFTLFDWYEPWNQVANSITWMRSALSRFAGDPSIALVEVKNEIDVTNSTVLAWTKAMLAALPSILPGVPRTVSVSGTQDLTAMRRLTSAIPQSDLDVIDSHLYGIDAVVGAKLAAAQAVANGRPIFVGEMGRPTAASASTCDDNAQAAFFVWMQTMLAKANVTGFAPWTYSDLDPAYLPSEYVGSPEANYGLRRLNGTWKPAAAIVQTMFGTGGGRANLATLAAQTEPYKYYDGGFECTASRTPSSATVSGSDGWTTFDAAQVRVAGTVPRQGVGGSVAGMLSGTTGDYRGSIPSLMRSFSLVSTGTVSVNASIRLVNATGYTTVALAWFKGSTYLGGSQAAPVNNSATGWQSVTVSGAPPAGADTVQIHLKSYANSGTAYFDNVLIRNISAAPTAAAAKTLTEAGAQTSGVTPQ